MQCYVLQRTLQHTTRQQFPATCKTLHVAGNCYIKSPQQAKQQQTVLTCLGRCAWPHVTAFVVRGLVERCVAGKVCNIFWLAQNACTAQLALHCTSLEKALSLCGKIKLIYEFKLEYIKYEKIS